MNALDRLRYSEDHLSLMIYPGDDPVSRDQVLKYLDRENIKGLINRDKITEVSDEQGILRIDEPIILAEAPSTLRVESPVCESLTTLREWQVLTRQFERAGEALETLHGVHDPLLLRRDDYPPTGYVEAGGTILRIHTSDLAEDLKGEAIAREPLKGIEFNSSCIKEIVEEEQMRFYIAEKSGYLCLKNGVLSLESPLWEESDYRLSFLFYPVIHDFQDVVESYYRVVENHKNKYPAALVPYLAGALPFEAEDLLFGPRREPVCNGVTPVQGRNAVIRILAREDRPEAGDDVDFRTRKNYITVKEGDILAEKIPCIEGVDGFSIRGEKIPVTHGRDKDLRVNELIDVEQEEERVVYRAREAGLLKVELSHLSLSQVMVISSDVDYNTGNIEFDRSVVVKRDIKPGFSVTTGGDLLVNGSVEDGAILKVGGDLEVRGGILGTKTRVEVDGNGQVRHIQDAWVYVAGSLEVAATIIGGWVFARESLLVRGQGSVKENRTVVFGGTCLSFKRLELHSAGSPFRKTMLICGYDPLAEQAFRKTAKILKALELNISQIMNRIGFNIANPAAQRLIQKMTPRERKELKAKLVNLKEVTSKFDEMKAQRARLEKEIFSERVGELEIVIEKRLKADVDVQFMTIQRAIREDYPGCRLKFGGDGVRFV